MKLLIAFAFALMMSLGVLFQGLSGGFNEFYFPHPAPAHQALMDHYALRDKIGYWTTGLSLVGLMFATVRFVHYRKRRVN